MTNEVLETNRCTVSVDSKRLDVPESCFFTYPTRLGNTWEPTVQKIISSSECIESRRVTLHAEQGNTKDISFKISSANQRRTPKSKLLKRQLQAILSRVNRRSKAPIDLRNDPSLIFDTRFHTFWTDGNIAHTLVNAAPLLLELKAMGQDVNVVVRKNPLAAAVEIYRLLGFQTIATDRDIDGNILVGESSRSDVHDWRMGCFGHRYENVIFEGYRDDTPKRIFISRSKRRCLKNEAEIEAILQQHGFVKYYFENLSISEQWSLAKNAEAVVAIHGAALAHLVFNRNSVKVIEMFNPGYHTRWFRTCVTAIDGQWCGVLGRFPSDSYNENELRDDGRKYALADLEVHPDSLNSALEYMNL